ncbi:MAG: TIGR00296 family protein, partial [Thermoplasmatota archaeon]
STERHFPSVFNKKHGAFVTLHTASNHLLRGCIGIPESIMPLDKAINEAATSVTHDPRFPPLTQDELSSIIVEVTILSPPNQVKITQPKEYLDQIKIGRDGLIVEQGFHKGLLLPQVPVEQEWDKETFLSQTCLKAGLPPDAWFDKETKVFTFTGQIFSEEKPYGSITEKTLV